MKFWKHSASVTVALMSLLAALIAGCGGSSNDGGLQLYLADDPLDAKAVNVTISRVDVSKDGVGWITLRDFGSSPVTINLLDYRYDGNTLTPDKYLLADTPLEAGHYTQIRLILTSIEIIDQADQPHQCEMNSQDQTGLKLIGQFEVASGAKTAVLIDFNAAKSIVAMGNGSYRLEPTVRVVPLQISGSLHGVVEFKDNSGTVIPAPTAATISAYQGTTLVGSALIDTQTGFFGIDGLVGGDYTLKLETTGFSAPDTNVTVTAGSDTDAGTVAATAM